MELRHLRYFVAIAEEQSFRRAAERLRVSQSPLSRQMKDLEEEMGVELFVPRGRGIQLSGAGKAFAERAKSILASVDSAIDEARGIAEGRLGTVVIGFETGTTFMGAFLSFIAAFSWFFVKYLSTVRYCGPIEAQVSRPHCSCGAKPFRSEILRPH